MRGHRLGGAAKADPVNFSDLKEQIYVGTCGEVDGDPATVDDRVGRLRAALESGELPPQLAQMKFLLLVNRESGDALGVALFDSENAMREGDRLLNAGPGQAGSRSSVEFYEVPIDTL